jgi:hypothetical protein
VVEAKTWDKALTECVAQAKDYAGKLALRFPAVSLRCVGMILEKAVIRRLRRFSQRNQGVADLYRPSFGCSERLKQPTV